MLFVFRTTKALKMKRFFVVSLSVLLIIALLPVHAFASEREKTTVTHFKDGSNLVETVFSASARASGTVSGTKESAYHGNDGSTKWKAVLNGTFTYTGSSATCTSASCSVTIYDDDWYTISRSASKSGNTAYGYATIGKKLLGVKVDEVSVSPTLKCDANGNLS